MNERSAFRTYWRNFIWAWMFPFVLLAVLLLPAYAERPKIVFGFVAMPLFFCVLARLASPFGQGKFRHSRGFSTSP
jgi:hypothetical protein